MTRTFEYESNLVRAGDFCAILTVTTSIILESPTVGRVDVVSVICEDGSDVPHSKDLMIEITKEFFKKGL